MNPVDLELQERQEEQEEKERLAIARVLQQQATSPRPAHAAREAPAAATTAVRRADARQAVTPSAIESAVRQVGLEISGPGADTILHVNLGKHVFELSLILENLATGSRVLDVGGGFGVNLMAIRRLTGTAHGLFLIDRFSEYTSTNRMGEAPRALRALRAAGVDVTESDFWSSQRLPYPDGHFDVVTFFDVVEHLPGSPVRFLAEIRRVLAPRGVLLMSGPNLRGLAEKSKFLLRRTHPYMDFDEWTSGRYFGHYREYTKEEYVRLLRLAGFKSINALLHVEPIRTMAIHTRNSQSRGEFLLKKLGYLLAFGVITAFRSLRPTVYCAART